MKLLYLTAAGLELAPTEGFPNRLLAALATEIC
jgi:hypothetical protein